jgi:hypothetical protein
MGNAEAKAAAEARFRACLAELGAILLEPYQSGHTPVRVRCAAGHECSPRPGDVMRGGNPCGACAGRSPAWTEARFRARLTELGVTLLEPYRGRHHPHRARCAAGHECSPRPGEVLKGGNPCGSCAGRNSAWSETKFRARLAELGGELLEPSWLGTHVRHRVRCAAGHETTPLPGNVIAGHGICATCARNDPIASEAAFRARLAELGATLLEPYQGNKHPYRVRCAAGHQCSPRPNDVMKGTGICRTCAGNDPAVAEAAFRARLAELGATLLEPYRGSRTPHRVRCAAGHECWPWPRGVRSGQGICLTCAGNDPAAAEARFRARLAELDATLLEPYRGSHTPVRVR